MRATRISKLVERLDALVDSGDTEAAWDQVDDLLALDAVQGWQYRVKLCRVAGPGRVITAGSPGAKRRFAASAEGFPGRADATLITANTLGHLGGALFETERFEEAAEAWSEAAEIYDALDSPSAAAMWESAGLALSQSGNHPAARAAYTRSLDAFAAPGRPTRRYARHGLATAFLKEKNYDDAFTAAWWGLRLPWSEADDEETSLMQAELWLALGYASFHLGRYSLADYAFRAVAASSLDPDLQRDAAEALEVVRTGLSNRGLGPFPIVDTGGPDFRVVWVGAADSMVARVDAGVFLLAGKLLEIGAVASDPR